MTARRNLCGTPGGNLRLESCSIVPSLILCFVLKLSSWPSAASSAVNNGLCCCCIRRHVVAKLPRVSVCIRSTATPSALLTQGAKRLSYSTRPITFKDFFKCARGRVRKKIKTYGPVKGFSTEILLFRSPQLDLMLVFPTRNVGHSSDDTAELAGA